MSLFFRSGCNRESVQQTQKHLLSEKCARFARANTRRHALIDHLVYQVSMQHFHSVMDRFLHTLFTYVLCTMLYPRETTVACCSFFFFFLPFPSVQKHKLEAHSWSYQDGCRKYTIISLPRLPFVQHMQHIKSCLNLNANGNLEFTSVKLLHKHKDYTSAD